MPITSPIKSVWTLQEGGIVGAAARFANRAHADQTRKVTGLPYIIHPYRVAELCRQAGLSDQQVAAAWCHDVLEDCPGYRAEASTRLPASVLGLVKQMTKAIDPVTGKGVKGEKFLAELRRMTPEAAAIKLADRIDNLRDGMACMSKEWLAGYVDEADQILTICRHGNGTLADQLDATIYDARARYA